MDLLPPPEAEAVVPHEGVRGSDQEGSVSLVVPQDFLGRAAAPGQVTVEPGLAEVKLSHVNIWSGG